MQSEKDEQIRCNEAVYVLRQMQLTLTSFTILTFVGKAFEYEVDRNICSHNKI